MDPNDKNHGRIGNNWHKGMPSPNPKGRPKNRKFYGEIAREILASNKLDVTITLSDNQGNVKTKTIKMEVNPHRTFYYALAAAQLAEGLKGNVKAANELINRADGRVPLAVQELPGDGQNEKKFIKVGDRYIEF
jgi:hypothetical protein